MTDPRANPSSPSHRARDDEACQGSQTETICEEAGSSQQASPAIHLRLQPPKEEHKVKWASDTVDNEFMGKKKSKCCCIYEKPKLFGESSTSEDEDGDGCSSNCRGHKKKCYRHKKSPHDHDHGHDGGHDDSENPPPEGGAMAT